MYKMLPQQATNKALNMDTLYVKMAYGKPYTKGAWLNGQDFMIYSGHPGMYCSVRDRRALQEQGYNKVVILDRLTNQTLETFSLNYAGG